MALTKTTYKVYKQSFIKKNSGVIIKPGLYKPTDYPNSVWEYLVNLPGKVCERIVETQEITIERENKNKSDYSTSAFDLKINFEDKDESPGVSFNVEKPIQNSTKTKTTRKRKTNSNLSNKEN